MAALIAFLTRMWTLFTRYNTFFAEGIKNTLIIAFFSVLLGTVFGTLMAMLRMSKVKPLRYLATAYIEFIRGTPLMVQLMFIFYGLPMTGIKLPDISWIPNFSRFAREVSDRTIFLSDGIIEEDKPSRELFAHPESPRLVSFLSKVL